jgi:hypothetical protein
MRLLCWIIGMLISHMDRFWDYFRACTAIATEFVRDGLSGLTTMTLQ